MPNWCSNHIVVTGPHEEITRFARTCIRRDEKGCSSFDFNSLIPMPAIIKNTIVTFDDILAALGPDGSIPRSLKERMEYSDIDNIEALKEKIRLEGLENADQAIKAFEQAGAPNWYVWAIRNWGTKWNASDFKVITEEPGRYVCWFETAWSPPEPVYVKLAEMFPRLSFEISGGDDQFNFDFEATARGGTFNIHYEDPNVEGFWLGFDSDNLLDHAKAYGNDPQRFLCVALCQAIASNQCYRDGEDPEREKAVVAWARGDTKENSENSCRDVIALNQPLIKTLVKDWQFTVYAPGEIRFQPPEPEARGVLTEPNDLPF
jgi:hypothetical protein